MKPTSLVDLEAWAKQQMPHDLWDFVAGGSADEITLSRNRTAFEAISINPRFLVDVSHRDLTTTVLGQTISFPVMVAPQQAGNARSIRRAKGQRPERLGLRAL